MLPPARARIPARARGPGRGPVAAASGSLLRLAAYSSNAARSRSTPSSARSARNFASRTLELGDHLLLAAALLALVKAIGDDDLGHRGGARRPREPDPHVPVGGVAERGVEAPELADERRSREHVRGPRGQHVERQELAQQLVRLRLPPEVERLEVVVDRHCTAVGEARPGGLDRRELEAELVRGPEVVVVEERHPPAGSRRDAGVPGRGETAALAGGEPPAAAGRRSPRGLPRCRRRRRRRRRRPRP